MRARVACGLCVLWWQIVAACDDNFSDDELLFLPLCAALSWAPPHPILTPALTQALRNAFDAELGADRSMVFGTIFLAAGGARDGAERERVMADVLWNLRTWPLETIDWPVINSERLDITYRPGVDRFRRQRTRSVRVLPANERLKDFRPAADPYDVADGGTGLEETDPGAWLLAFWMARYHRLL